MTFDELIESEQEELGTLEDYLYEFYLASCDESELDELKEELGLTDEEFKQHLDEAMTKHVSSKGKVTRTRSRKQRSRSATRTTGMSKSELRRRAKKAARTRRKNPASLKKAIRKRQKAMKRRRAMHI